MKSSRLLSDLLCQQLDGVVQNVRLLDFNVRKQTAILVGVMGQQDVFIKVIENTAAPEFKEGFANEQQWLKKLNGIVAPKFFYITENITVTEYVAGETLHTHLELSGDDGGKLLMAMLSTLKEFNASYCCGDTLEVDRYFLVNESLKIFNRLMTSKAAGQRSMNWFRKLVHKSVFLLYRNKIEDLLNRSIDELELKNVQWGRFYHGDAHLNNFYIFNNSDIYLIDFEKSLEKKGLFCDLLYCVSIYSSLLGNKVDTGLVLKNAMGIDMKCTYTETVFDIFYLAAYSNSGFSRNSNFRSLIKLMYKLREFSSQ